MMATSEESQTTSKNLKEDLQPLKDYGTINEDTPKERSAKIPCPPCRLVLIVLGFLVNSFSLRTILSVTLVAMVNHTMVIPTDPNDDQQSPHNKSLSNSSDSRHVFRNGEFRWDMPLQGTVLAAFFYGNISTQVLGGWLADRFGGKWFFGGGVLAAATSTLLIPVLADWNVGAVIAARVITGMGAGLMNPTMHALQAVWIPPHERTRAMGFFWSGTQMGIVISMTLSGVLCDYGFDGGWPSVFYIFGAIDTVWALAWLVLCYNTPAEHPLISSAERSYIEQAVAHGHKFDRSARKPWKAILTSRPFWALAVAYFAYNWGYHTLGTCLPKFMHDVLGFDMTEDGVLSSLPSVAAFAVIVACGFFSDWLRGPSRLSTTTVRKLLCAVGLFLPGLLLVIVGFIGANRAAVVSVVVVAVGFTGFASSVISVNPLDLAPPHAATLMGLAATIASIASIAAPQVVGAFTSVNSTRAQWRNVFYTACAIYCSAGVFYLVFGSGQEQDWAREKETLQPPLQLSSGKTETEPEEAETETENSLRQEQE